MRQGAVGHVRAVERSGRRAVEKRMTDPLRHDTEVLALRAASGGGLPVPELIDVGPGFIVMSLMPGVRLDESDPEVRRRGLAESMPLMRRLHTLSPPAGLPRGPDDALIVRRYREAGGPALQFVVPPPHDPVFCHGDWTDGNLLAADGRITAVLDWEAAHLGDPLREVSRTAWGAARKDPRSFEVIVDAYGADAAEVRAWLPIHAAELWLWFRDAGPPEYLRQLTAELTDRPQIIDGRDDVNPGGHIYGPRETGASAEEVLMTDSERHARHADDARADDGPPTDAFTDEVRADAATAEDGDDGATDDASGSDSADFPSSDESVG